MSQEYLDKLDSRQNGKSEEARMKTEVVVKAKRRQYLAEYKLRILREIDECKGKGEAGALLRRGGIVFIISEQVEGAA